MPSLTVNPDLSSTNLDVPIRQKRRPESTVESREDHSTIQNLAQDSKPPVYLRRTLEDDGQTRRLEAVPGQTSTTTAIVHQEQSPWMGVRDDVSDDDMNTKNMVLQRAKSMNVNTAGKPMKTDIQQNERQHWWQADEDGHSSIRRHTREVPANVDSQHQRNVHRDRNGCSDA